MDFKGNARCTCGKEMEGSGGSFSGTLTTSWRSCECGIKSVFYAVPEGYELSICVEHKDKKENRALEEKG